MKPPAWPARPSNQVYTKALIVLLTAAGALSAQSYYPRHNFTFAAGGAQPGEQLRGFLHSKPGISFGYGYRFQRYFQIDGGFDTVFGAANVRAFEPTEFGLIRIRDYQFFLPAGGRAILPLAGGRVLFSGGGGGAYMRYTEMLRQPSNYFRIDCFSCSARSGWGYYALADLSTFIDRGQHFRVGVVTKVYRGHTQGDPFAGVPGIRTRDAWMNVMGQVGFSF